MVTYCFPVYSWMGADQFSLLRHLISSSFPSFSPYQPPRLFRNIIISRAIRFFRLVSVPSAAFISTGKVFNILT